MQRVKYFQADSMIEIEKEINEFLEDSIVRLKIFTIALTVNNNIYHALVTYGIN